MKARALAEPAAVAKKAKSSCAIPDSFTGGPPKRDLVPSMTYDEFAAMFKAAEPPPGVLPKGQKLAMDSAFAATTAWIAGAQYNLAFIEGWTFMGYPYLAQLANIPEYRLIGETIASEATRKWVEVKSRSGKQKQKAEKIQDLNTELDRLGAKAAFKWSSEFDSWYGRAHLYLDTGDTDNPKELTKPLGDGGVLSEKKFKKGMLRALKTVEPVWCYPSRYDAADPLKDNWYKPNAWFVNGKEVDSTRLLTFIGRPVSDLLKPAFSFGGLSLSQMAKPYVDNWLQTRQSVNNLIQAFSTMVLGTDLQGLIQTGGQDLVNRIAAFNNTRNNSGVFVINKDAETFANVSAPLGSLDKLQAQAQEHICSVSQLPLVKYTGISPSGLNATGDNEIRVFYDREHAYQETFFDKHFTVVFRLAQINIWGAVDEDLFYVWRPLMELDEKALAEVEKTKAETSKTLVDGGIIDQSEARVPLANSPDQPYGDMDPDDVPENEMPEEGNVRVREDEELGGEKDQAA